MAVEACNCTDGLSGWGLSGCFNKFGYPLGYAFQKIKNSTGGTNSLTASAGGGEIAQGDWEAFLWAADKNERINTLVNVKAVLDERADANTEDVDGIEMFVSEGARKISFEVYGVPSALKGFIEGLRCGEYGFYPISNTKNLGGLKTGSEVAPIPMEYGTISVKEVFQTKTGQQKLMVTFQVSEDYNDSDFGFIPANLIDADLLGTSPQIKATVTGAATATSSGVMDVAVSYVANNSIVSQPIEGLLTSAYYVLTNSTTSSTVAISGVIETSPGNYEISYTAQTASNVLVLSYNDGSPVEFESITFTEV